MACGQLLQPEIPVALTILVALQNRVASLFAAEG